MPLFNVASTWGQLFLDSCDSVNGYCSQGWKQNKKKKRKKRNLTHVPPLFFFFFFFISDVSPVPIGGNWSGHRRLCRLAATQADPRGKSKYKCRTREQGSFLYEPCLCRSALLASCPSWGLAVLSHGILGLWVYVTRSFRGQCTRGSAARAVWITLDEECGNNSSSIPREVILGRRSASLIEHLTEQMVFKFLRTLILSSEIWFSFLHLDLETWHKVTSTMSSSARNKQPDDQTGCKSAKFSAWLPEKLSLRQF